MVGKRKMDIFSWCVISTLPCRRETRKKNTSRNQISTKLWLVSKYPAQTAVKYHLSWLNQSPSCTSVLSSFSLFFVLFLSIWLSMNVSQGASIRFSVHRMAYCTFVRFIYSPRSLHHISCIGPFFRHKINECHWRSGKKMHLADSSKK